MGTGPASAAFERGHAGHGAGTADRGVGHGREWAGRGGLDGAGLERRQRDRRLV